jgi:hypothetical protein
MNWHRDTTPQADISKSTILHFEFDRIPQTTALRVSLTTSPATNAQRVPDTHPPNDYGFLRARTPVSPVFTVNCKEKRRIRQFQLSALTG